jgi:Zn-dependent M28 family amino/carboxypeptidase
MDFYITNRFTNLTNIALRISTPKARANAQANAHAGAILINTHYDSALGGLGATDAGALVAVMIEMLRNILNSNEEQFELNYPLISLA